MQTQVLGKNAKRFNDENLQTSSETTSKRARTQPELHEAQPNGPRRLELPKGKLTKASV